MHKLHAEQFIEFTTGIYNYREREQEYIVNLVPLRFKLLYDL